MAWKWILPLLLAAVAGALMPAQGAANSWLARRSSLVMATFWVHASATVIMALLLLIMPAARTSWGSLLRAGLPALTGGVMGVGITWLVAAAVAPLGMVAATTAILVAQVAMAGFLDHLGLFGLEPTLFSWTKGLGALFLLFGAWLMLRK